MAKKEDLINVVGESNVFDDPDTLEGYSKDLSFVLPRKPEVAVKPQNADHVQAIVKWANDTGTPLVPVSSGPPRFRGDTVPGSAGAVMVDVSGMKRIIRIDRRNRMTLIEPGVTYSELQPALASEGLRVSMPLIPRSNKSVIASLLEREPILTPRYQWTILEPLRCMEIIWGNGDKLWTGEAGRHPLSLEKQWERKLAQVNPHGPLQTDYWRLVSAAQGSMGIVTWASIKCEILPQLHKLFFIPAARLNELVDCAYRLLRFRLGDELFLLNSSDLSFILGKDSHQIMTLKEKLPPWAIVIGVAGRDMLPRERVENHENGITGVVQQFGLKLESTIPGASDGEMLEAISNPSMKPYWKLGYKGQCEDIFLLTTLDRTPELITTMLSVAEKLNYPTSEIGIYIQPLHQGVSCHCEFNIPYDSDDAGEETKIRELFTKASEALINQGAFFSRPYGIWADMQYNRDPQQRTMLRKVKGIFDPNNVMNPGKLCFYAQ